MDSVIVVVSHEEEAVIAATDDPIDASLVPVAGMAGSPGVHDPGIEGQETGIVILPRTSCHLTSRAESSRRTVRPSLVDHRSASRSTPAMRLVHRADPRTSRTQSREDCVRPKHSARHMRDMRRVSGRDRKPVRPSVSRTYGPLTGRNSQMPLPARGECRCSPTRRRTLCNRVDSCHGTGTWL